MSGDDDTRPGPLDGTTVLDLSRFIAGPTCAQVLADFGAQVVKIERPSGEDARHHEPYHRGESVYTMLYNRNKLGATLDTRHPAAGPVLDRLVAWADVVVENYRPGTLDTMGLNWERMTTLNPAIVLTSISGFGQTGPLSRRALFDAIAQASSGLMDVTGEGQRVDVASLDAMFAMLGTRLVSWLMLGEEMPRSGSRDLLTAPVNVYPCRDAQVYIQAGTTSLFARLCRAIGREDLLDRDEYATVPGRMAHGAELEAVVGHWARDRDADEVGGVLDAAGIPWARVATVPEVAESPQIAARGMVVTTEHPTLGPLRLPGNPIKMDRSPPTVRTAPPTVGQDNDRVYTELLGMDHDELAALRASGALG